MSRPDEVLDSGLSQGEKKAVSVRYGPDGEIEILKIAEGQEAEAMIARAQADGIDVRLDKEKVDNLFQSRQASSRVPPEVYELMSIMVQFAQELDETWGSGTHN